MIPQVVFIVECDSTHNAVAVVCIDGCVVLSPVHVVEVPSKMSVAFIF